MTILGRIFHQGCERETTLGGAAKGLATGALTGTGLVGVSFVVAGGLGGMGAVAVPMAIFVMLYALPVWAVGLLVFGVPGWWLLHRLGARCQQAAMIYGGGLCFVAALAVVGWAMTSGGEVPDLAQVLVLASILALMGAAVGWVVAKIAYKPKPVS